MTHLLSVFWCLFLMFVFGKTAAGAIGIEWQFTEYRDYSHPAARSLSGAEAAIEWAEEGFVIAGGNETAQATLVKLSPGGQFILRTNYNGSNFDITKVNDLVVLSDGSLAAAGESERGGANELGAAFVFHLSHELELMWWKDVRVGTYKNSAKQVTLAADGSIGVAGYSTLLDMYQDGSFARLNFAGDVLVTNRYDKSTEEEEFIRDDRFAAIKNWNGGFVMAGISDYDFWIMAVDNLGVVLWDKTIGEGGAAGLWEGAFDLEVLSDGGFLLGGYSKSPPGAIKTSPHYGGEDYWVVRLDGERNIVWQRSYGGTGDDRLVSLDVTEDGGYVLGGWSDSPVSGNKTAAHRGGTDYWVIRTDAQGEVLWEETYGGSEDDELVSIEQTSDGGYIIGGNSSSGADGNKTKPETGWWIIKLAAEGAARLSAPAQSAAEIAAEGFRMTLSGEPGTSYVLERSADLSDWTPISTNLLTESEMELRDPAPGTEMNFHRAKQSSEEP